MSTSSTLLLARVRTAMEDEYKIDGEIGRGGMAAVFLAHDLSLDRKVAIKVMLPDLIDVAGLQDRFVTEARTAASLDHPGIVTVYSVKQRDGLLFIIMKFVEGQTLDDVMKARGALEPHVVAAFGARLAEALQFAHNEGIIHRDIKPSNVIIDKRGRPVITDFGIAKVMSARSVTVAGSMLGTPTYMSPEQCRGLPATAASDQYSLGVMMYEMLAGRPPFLGGLYELVRAHSAEAPPPLGTLVQNLDPDLEATVMRMLEKDPDDRWASLAAAAQSLKRPTSSDAVTKPVTPVSDVDETLPIIGTTRVESTPVPRIDETVVVIPSEEVAEESAVAEVESAAENDVAEAAPRRRSTTTVVRRQRNIGLAVGLVGAIIGVVGAMTMLQNQTANQQTKAPVVADPAPKAAAEAPPASPVTVPATGVPSPPPAIQSKAKSDSARPTPNHPKRDSIPPQRQAQKLDSATALQCRKIRERWTVGDSLSAADEQMLRGICAR